MFQPQEIPFRKILLDAEHSFRHVQSLQQGLCESRLAASVCIQNSSPGGRATNTTCRQMQFTDCMK